VTEEARKGKKEGRTKQPKLTRIEPLVINVSSKTNWFFLRVTTDDGATGVGEASLNGWESLQLAYVAMLAPELNGQPIDQIAQWLRVYPHSPGGLVAASVRSALEQALTDVRAKRQGLSVHQMLGGALRNEVRVYANINRRTRDRSAQGFAKSARDAVEIGFGAVKIAPFDGVVWEDFGIVEARSRISLGLDRVFAAREAVGPDVDLMVDCHWRFDEPTAAAVLRELAAAKIFWLECPVSEQPEHWPALARLRALANEYAIRLAGAESQIGVAAFQRLAAPKLFDVVMPDIKYCGGFAEMQKIAAATAAYGLSVAPHNPTGPVCNMATIHACAVATNFLILEYQLAESPLYSDVVKGFEPALIDGCFVLPDTPGIGVDLDDDVVRAHPYRPLPSNANLDPRLG
jgi:galactonate dehydratase